MTDNEALIRENQRLRGECDHKDQIIANLVYFIQRAIYSTNGDYVRILKVALEGTDTAPKQEVLL